MWEWQEKGFAMVAKSARKRRVADGEAGANGIVSNFAYTVIKLASHPESTRLIILRNPMSHTE